MLFLVCCRYLERQKARAEREAADAGEDPSGGASANGKPDAPAEAYAAEVGGSQLSCQAPIMWAPSFPCCGS